MNKPIINENKECENSFLKKVFKSKEVGVFIALMILCVLLSALSPYFFTTKNIFNVLRQFSLIGILAVGEAFVIITAGIDLSVGGILAISACTGAIMTVHNVNFILVFIFTLLIGSLIGGVNGLIITKANINPFIVTMGMASITKGATLLVTDGLPIDFQSKLAFLGGGYLGPIPITVIIMCLVVVIGHIFANNTLTGRNIYAVGNNERAAVLSGINSDRIKLLVYTIMGCLCALSGILLAGNLNNADPSFGAGYEMDAIAAVVIGGCSLSGGEGSIVGVIIGAALMGVLRNGFILLGVSAYWQTVTIGAVIILAVGIDSFRNMRKN